MWSATGRTTLRVRSSCAPPSEYYKNVGICSEPPNYPPAQKSNIHNKKNPLVLKQLFIIIVPCIYIVLCQGSGVSTKSHLRTPHAKNFSPLVD